MASGSFNNKWLAPLLPAFSDYADFYTKIADVPDATLFMFTGSGTFTSAITNGQCTYTSKGFGVRYTGDMVVDVFFMHGSEGMYMCRFKANQSSATPWLLLKVTTSTLI